MSDRRELSTPPPRDKGRGRSPWRFVPLAAVAALSILIWSMGWHRHLSFELFVHQHAALRDFIAQGPGRLDCRLRGALRPGGGAVGAGRAVPDGCGRDHVRRAPGRSGRVGRRDGRRNLHFPDRQERARRASCALRRAAGCEARGRLPCRRLQLSVVPAFGSDLPVLARQSGSGIVSASASGHSWRQPRSA